METNPTPAVPGAHLVTGPAPTLLELQGIRKVFLTDEVETHALSDVHLAVKKGEWLAIVGPFLLDGKPVQDLSPADRAHVRNKHIGFIFQSFNLIGDLTVFENVELPLTYRGTAPDQRKKRVDQALERVGMSHRARHMPGQLSGGQQQRVAVARAVAGDPLILLADEPTGNLDSKNGQAVMKLLRELHQSGSTLIMVTHDPAYARLASRTVTLFDGRIVDESNSPGGEGQLAPSA